MKRKFPILMLCGVTWALSGCTSPEEEVKARQAEIDRSITPRKSNIEAPRPFTPQSYDAESTDDPFSVARVNALLRADTSQNSALLKREQERRKEPLENYSLEALQMVGYVKKEGKVVALVKADQQLYKVQVGDHMGAAFGKVVQIKESEIVLREIVQDAAGEWIERMTSMQLQEKSR